MREGLLCIKSKDSVNLQDTKLTTKISNVSPRGGRRGEGLGQWSRWRAGSCPRLHLLGPPGGLLKETRAISPPTPSLPAPAPPLPPKAHLSLQPRVTRRLPAFPGAQLLLEGQEVSALTLSRTALSDQPVTIMSRGKWSAHFARSARYHFSLNPGNLPVAPSAKITLLILPF